MANHNPPFQLGDDFVYQHPQYTASNSQAGQQQQQPQQPCQQLGLHAIDPFMAPLDFVPVVSPTEDLHTGPGHHYFLEQHAGPQSLAAGTEMAIHGPPGPSHAATEAGPSGAISFPEKAEAQSHLAMLEAAEDKRRRNTEASARFRVKKKERELALERTAGELEAKVERLERRVEELERENGWLRDLVVGRSRGGVVGGKGKELKDKGGKAEGKRVDGVGTGEGSENGTGSGVRRGGVRDD